jgi:hypothetical protein
MYGVWFGRFLSYSLLWLAVYLIGKRLSEHTHWLVTLGLFVVAPFTLEMLIYPTDPLFAAMAALAFGQVLAYLKTGRAGRLAWASTFVGLAVLARPDGTVLSGAFLCVVVLLGLRAKALRTALPAGLIPLVLLVGGYTACRGAITGDFSTGMAGRAYTNFEAGHGIIYQAPGEIDREIENHLEAQRVYGTPQENGYSILRAIAKRPDVYVERMEAAVRFFPHVLLRAYGIRFGAVLFLLALRGMIELFRKNRWMLATMLLWMAPVLTGFVLTLFRTGHLLFPFYVLIALAGIGVMRIPDDLAVYGIVDAKLAITYGVIIFLMALVLVRVLITRAGDSAPVPLSVFLLLFCAGLVIHGSYPSPVLRSPGTDPIEETVAYLVEHYERDEPLAAGYPGIAWEARMTFVGLVDEDVPLESSPRQFLVWMADQGVRVVFIDRTLFVDNPAIWRLIAPELDNGLQTVFSTDGGDLRLAEIHLDQ